MSDHRSLARRNKNPAWNGELPCTFMRRPECFFDHNQTPFFRSQWEEERRRGMPENKAFNILFRFFFSSSSLLLQAKVESGSHSVSGESRVLLAALTYCALNRELLNFPGEERIFNVNRAMLSSGGGRPTHFQFLNQYPMKSKIIRESIPAFRQLG